MPSSLNAIGLLAPQLTTFMEAMRMPVPGPCVTVARSPLVLHGQCVSSLLPPHLYLPSSLNAPCFPASQLTIFTELPAFVAALKAPRKVLLSIHAGASIDELLAELGPLLAPGDVVLDGGNEHFAATAARAAAAAEKYQARGTP